MGADFFGRGNLVEEPPMPRFLANSIGGSHRRQRNHPLYILAVTGGGVESGSKTFAANLICKKKISISFSTRCPNFRSNSVTNPGHLLIGQKMVENAEI